MLSRRALTSAARVTKPTIRSQTVLPRAQFSTTRCVKADIDVEDPDMNGGYINPPAIKRSQRDPYGDWTDKQDRRNFGEPVHEDNDILGVFSLEEYTHMSPLRGAVCWVAFFIGPIVGLYYTVKTFMPDKPSYPKEYEGGLEAEMGGPGAVRARKAGDQLEDVRIP